MLSFLELWSLASPAEIVASLVRGSAGSMLSGGSLQLFCCLGSPDCVALPGRLCPVIECEGG